MYFFNFIKAVFLILLLAASVPALGQGTDALVSTTLPHPFFFMGDGRLKMKNNKNSRAIDVRLYDKDKKLKDEAFYQVDHLFGFPSREKGEHISQRMIFMLDYFSDHFALGKTIYLTSGYRSPQYNDNLRKQGKTAGKTSTHIDGMALDFYIEGVSGHDMWEYIRHKDCCGVGHYGGKNIHLDAGRPRFWEKSTSKVWSGASDYNRYIYLSTDYDRYRKESKVRLFFTSISDFGFGIKPVVQFVTDKEGEKTVAKAKIETKENKKCIMVNRREEARFIYTTLPKKLKPGRYRIRLDFCERPFEEMPEFRVSNEIEVVKTNE